MSIVPIRGRHLKKSDMVEMVKRRLGYPLVKVELDESQINDNITYTRNKWIKWAIGQSTKEFFFALALSAGTTIYELDDVDPNITEVIGYSTQTAGSIHTLFTMENYMYNAGMYDQLMMRAGGDGYSMVSYHIARDFIETIKRYVVDPYDFTYHQYDNTLEIWPDPGTTSSASDPGWLLCRAFRIEADEGDIYASDWFIDYLTAMCKITLGRVRTKFANFQAVGSNISLSMDGEALIAEGKEEIERLEERLRLEEPWEQGWIILG